MKVLITFAAVFLVINAFTDHQHWIKYKTQHGKIYKNVLEEKLRFTIFQNNLKKINDHNAKYEAGLSTYTMAVNQFADMTEKEFADMVKFQNGPRSTIHGKKHIQNMALTVPDSIDWREKIAVSDIIDQGLLCASCWAISAVGAIEGQNAIVNNKTVPLSAQQLNDCVYSYGGCGGGNMHSAFEYAMKNNITTEEEYPYEAKDGECRVANNTGVSIKGYKIIEPTETALRDAVGTVGPVSVAVFSTPLMFYFGGIYQSDDCVVDQGYLDHGVLAVGYGIDNGKKYWIVKNSWGSWWGEKGYLRLARDADQCGIKFDTSYPVM